MMKQLVVLALILCPLRAQSVSDDPEAIVRRSVERDATNSQRLTNYTFIEHRLERVYGKNGKLKSTEDETAEILILGGRPYDKLIARDGKPLPEKDARKEQEKLDKEAAKRQRESNSDKAKLEKERAEERRFLREVPDAFTFRLLGVEPVSGKPAWVIQADPKPTYKPRVNRADLLKKVRAKIWIDQGEYQWVKADAEVIDSLSFGLGFFKIAPGGTIHFEQMRMNDEVWVPLAVTVRADARLAYLSKLRGEIDVNYSDYKKFQAESRIISTGDQ
jgi:hypothetical protein